MKFLEVTRAEVPSELRSNPFEEIPREEFDDDNENAQGNDDCFNGVFCKLDLRIPVGHPLPKNGDFVFGVQNFSVDEVEEVCFLKR